MTRNRKIPGLVPLLVAAVLLTSACGVSSRTASESGSRVRTTVVDESPEAEDLRDGAALETGSFEGTGGAVFLSKAAEATAGVESYRMAMTMTMDGLPGVGSVTMTVDGAIDEAAEQAHLTMDMGDLLLGLDGEMEVILDGDQAYVRSSLFTMFSTDGKPWVSMPASEFAEDDSFGAASNEPGAFLDFLRDTGSEVTEVGREEVRGVDTMHVQVDLDIEALMAEATEEERAEMEATLDGLGEGADAFRSIPAEAWIDGDGFVRRFTMTFDFSGLAETDPELDGVTMTIDFEMFDLGQPVDIEPPDPADVGTLDESFAGMGD